MKHGQGHYDINDIIDYAAATIDAVWDDQGQKRHVVHDQRGHTLGTFADPRLGLLFLGCVRDWRPEGKGS